MLFEPASFTITGIQSYCMQQYGEQFHTSHKAGLYTCISLHEAHLEVSEGRAVELRDNMQCGANDKDQFEDMKWAVEITSQAKTPDLEERLQDKQDCQDKLRIKTYQGGF